MQALDDFLSGLEVSIDAAHVWQSTARYLESFGLDKLIRLGSNGEAVCLLTTLGADWLRHYQTSGYANVDPFLRYCVTSPAPIATGIAFLPTHTYLGRKERDLIVDASDAGFISGMSCATRPGTKEFQAWNLGSSLDATEFGKVMDAHAETIQLAVHLADRELSEFEFQTMSPLSAREIQCVSLLAKGLRTKEIAGVLGLKPVTIELYLKNARDKLGCATRDELVARVVSAGWIGR